MRVKTLKVSVNMITLKTKLKDFIKLCKTKGACGDAITWMESQLKDNPEILVDKSISVYLADKTLSEMWAFWLLKNIKELDVDIQNRYITKITNPMTALQLLLDCDFLSDAQDVVLKSKYEGKLPTAEKELQTSIVVTAKSKLDTKI